MTTMICHCCGGDMPPRPIWEANRDSCPCDCTGSVDRRGRCRAWSDDELWQAEHTPASGEEDCRG